MPNYKILQHWLLIGFIRIWRIWAGFLFCHSLYYIFPFLMFCVSKALCALQLIYKMTRHTILNLGPIVHIQDCLISDNDISFLLNSGKNNSMLMAKQKLPWGNILWSRIKFWIQEWDDIFSTFSQEWLVHYFCLLHFFQSGSF